MDANALREFIEKVSIASPDNCLSLYFSRWSAPKYISYSPQLSSELQKEIVAMVVNPLQRQLTDTIVDYNPIGVGDGEIEQLKISSISHVATYLDSITDINVIKEMSILQIDKIDFYCIRITHAGKDLFLFRQFQKLKRLRKGLFAQIVNNELKALCSGILGIDDITDIVLFGDEAYIINHISLERVFKYRDEFLKRTNEALGELLKGNVIINIDQFTEDCCNDIRIMKRFTNIMTKGRLPLFFDNYDKVSEIVKELDLDIDFDESGKLVYRERSQLFHIINLLSDSYFRTLLADRTGVAKLEGEL